MNKLVTTVLITIAIAFLAYLFLGALEIPDVYVSYATNECVKVVNYGDTNFSCENMPTKFNHVWAK